MKSYRSHLVMTVLIVAVALFVSTAMNTHAQSDTPQQTYKIQVVQPTPNQDEDGLSLLVAQWSGLAGFGALVALLINVGKALGFIKDGQAKNWSAGINMLGMAFLLFIGIIKPDLNIKGVDAAVNQFVNVAAVVIGYMIQIASSRITHNELRGLPVVGTTFTPKE